MYLILKNIVNFVCRFLPQVARCVIEFMELEFKSRCRGYLMQYLKLLFPGVEAISRKKQASPITRKYGMTRRLCPC